MGCLRSSRPWPKSVRNSALIRTNGNKDWKREGVDRIDPVPSHRYAWMSSEATEPISSRLTSVFLQYDAQASDGDLPGNMDGTAPKSVQSVGNSSRSDNQKVGKNQGISRNLGLFRRSPLISNKRLNKVSQTLVLIGHLNRLATEKRGVSNRLAPKGRADRRIANLRRGGTYGTR
jgi:hypothetical protein